MCASTMGGAFGTGSSRQTAINTAPATVAAANHFHPGEKTPDICQTTDPSCMAAS